MYVGSQAVYRLAEDTQTLPVFHISLCVVAWRIGTVSHGFEKCKYFGSGEGEEEKKKLRVYCCFKTLESGRKITKYFPLCQCSF